tara:strand:- start:15777 stop:17873 length:2097 start_codon:yes stop_codon:yes gene_type:complete
MAINNKVNSGSINRTTVNPSTGDSVNSPQFNGIAINGLTDAVIVPKSGSGSLLDLEQTVAHIGAGISLSLEQTVRLLEQGSGPLVNIEQSLETLASGALVALEQRVWTPTVTSRLDRRKHDVAVFLDGYQIPDSQLTETLQIEYNEDAAAVCTLVLFPGTGLQDLSFYYGKTIIVNITKPDKTTYRAFSGVVDIVDFDIIDGKTRLECTNRRVELLDAIVSPETKFGSVFDQSLITTLQGSSSEKISQLLPFAAKSLDFDSYDNWYYTSWTPKATADITLAAADVFRRDPQMDLVNRGSVVNSIEVKFTYGLKRLHYLQSAYSWVAPYDSGGANFSVVLEDGYTLTRRDTILAAIEGTNWPVKGQVLFAGLPPAGFYGGAIWYGDSKQQTTSAKTDEDGNTVTDSDGNTVFETSTTRTFDMSGLHATTADFTLTKRWSQDISKEYTFTVAASTSQALFGTVDRESSYSVSDGYDAARWDNYERYESTFQVAPGITFDLGSGSSSVNIGTKESLVNSNIRAALEKARVEILKTHRDNTVTVETDVLPEVQLNHTIHVNAPGKLEAIGKTSKYVHTIDFINADASTEIEIKFYKLGSGGSDTATTLPNNPAINLTSFPTTPPLDNFYGENPNTTFFLKKAGWFGNRYETFRGNTQRTGYQEQFRVDTPAIPGELTDGVVYPASKAINVAIPAGTLNVTYD